MTLIVVAAYFLTGATIVGVRAWFAGKHRLIHGGARGDSSCEHYGCSCMFWEVLLLTLAFWPAMVPLQLFFWLLHKLIRAPYLRSLPPVGSSKKEEIERELIDAALGLGSVGHFTGKSAYDEKWNRLDRAMKAMIDLRARQ